MKNIKAGHIRPIVCLDPGHDSGKANPSPVVAEYFEGQRMWDLAQLLVPRLEAYGIEVRVTKSQLNQAIDLVVRGEISKGTDLLISLHSNAAATPQPDWVLVLYQVDNGGGVYEQSRRFAELLAPSLAKVMGVDYQVYARQSSSDRDNNGNSDDYYGVLRGAQTAETVGVIVEHGFHTNEQTARWLLQDSNLEKIADTEAAVIAQWFGVHKTEVPQQWYRIRLSWENAASQVGAYGSLQNAVAACPVGYSVYDWRGNAVYSHAQTYTQQQFVRELQGAIFAAVDGIAGPETLSKTPTISAVKNNRHDVVRPVQKRLYALGYTQVGAADGIAGPLFTAAVKAYQKANGCVCDGEITARECTWQKLLGLR